MIKLDITLWAEKSFKQLENLIRGRGVAILPIGSTEQHGPHLPVGTDHIIAWEVAKRVAERTGSLLLPLIPIGFSEDHYPKAGTLTLSAETLRRMIRDLAKSLSRNGVKHIVVISGHAGHLAQLNDICYELNVTGELGETLIHNISPFTLIPIEAYAGILEEEVLMHAEELETSLMLLLRPDLVDMKEAVKEIPDFIPKGLNTTAFMEGLRILTTSKFLGRDLKHGVCGDPTLASKEKGEKILELWINAITEAVENATRT
ncbi:MAG: creatininase family protein [Candidatus Bathyarchaeia archaeon]